MPRFFLAKTGLLILGLLLFFSPAPSQGMELHIPALAATAGKTLNIPIMLDKAVDLAGVKLAIAYDQKILAFQKAAKTRETSSLMHIVNDKKPGRLIIVMAGARGVSGEKFAILDLEFTISGDITKTTDTRLDIQEVQLMDSTLKNIACKTSTLPLVISPAEKTAPEPQHK